MAFCQQVEGLGALAVKDSVGWSEVSGIPAGFADGVDNGIASESDPTVLASVKNGVSWTEVTSKPAGFADGVDNVGVCTVSSNCVIVEANYGAWANCPSGYVVVSTTFNLGEDTGAEKIKCCKLQ